jgi:hypothetical protein
MMTVIRDYGKYHHALTTELHAMQDLIRHLIGGSHWATDGEHKEAILRKALRSRLPDSIKVGKGFACNPAGETGREQTTQIDILLTHADRPVLFRDNELVIVTPEAVAGIIEVKTNCKPYDLLETINKLADNIELVRHCRPNSNSSHEGTWAGLFVYGNWAGSNEQLAQTVAAHTE